MAEKKKVLYIVEAMGGGVFTYIVDLANELVNSYDMYIAYAVRKQTPENYKEYFDKRIHLIEVKNFGRAIDPAKDIAAFFEVKKIAEDIKPDVIHLHSSKAGAIGRVAFNGKIPMFYTPHGYSFLMENYKPMKRRMFKLIESVCAKRNCTTISCSVGEHQESLKLTKRATYVNNGIKSLQKSGAQITNIVVTDNNIKSFDRVARKYGIDYSLKKVEQEGKSEYLVFFKAKDVDVMTAAFKEYTSETLKKQKRESVRQKLEKVKEELSNHRQLKKEKKREQEPIR